MGRLDGDDPACCAACEFWHKWRTVMLADDEPKLLGYCVVRERIDQHFWQSKVQGLTAENYLCVNYHRKRVEP